MDSLLAKLSEQQALLAKQKTALAPVPESDKKADEAKQVKDDSSASSTLLTPASESFGHSSPTTEGEETIRVEAEEMARLKKELDAAKDQIARQKQELDQTRVIKHTFDQAIGPPSDTVIGSQVNATAVANTLTGSSRPINQAQGPYDDVRSDGSDTAGSFNTVPNVWSSVSRPGINSGLQPEPGWGQSGSRMWNQRETSHTLPPVMMPPQQPMQARNYSMPVSPIRGSSRGMNDIGPFNQGRGFAQGNSGRNASFSQRGTGWEVYAGGPGPMDDMNLSGMTGSSGFPSLGMYPPPYQPRPIGTPLSPTAPEFRGSGGQVSANPWNNAVSQAPN